VPFGPGELIEYHFTAPSEVLQAVTVSFTAEVVPTMGDFEPLAPLPVATANVQVVPEPSMWLLLAAGLGCLTLVRMRLRQPAPALGSAG
jgi:hypothetical protein